MIGSKKKKKERIWEQTDNQESRQKSQKSKISSLACLFYKLSKFPQGKKPIAFRR
jgi:hypothetical protein